jgi:ABC-type polysaccharide/polyol phosphate transport system ATPase subunit
VIEIINVSKKFRIWEDRNRDLKERTINFLRGKKRSFRDVWALKEIDLMVREGETVAFIGENGSGKSTLLKLLGGIYAPDEGKIVTRGKISTLLELGVGFHPDLTGEENVYLNGAMLGFDHAEMEEKFDAIVSFSEIADFIYSPIRTYSSGMLMRLGFSVAMCVNPDILLLDEVLAVGDEAFQKKCLARLETFKVTGKTIILVSHSMEMVQKFCDRAILLHEGRVVSDDLPERTVHAYHVVLYGQGYASTPQADPEAGKREAEEISSAEIPASEVAAEVAAPEVLTDETPAAEAAPAEVLPVEISGAEAASAGIVPAEVVAAEIAPAQVFATEIPASEAASVEIAPAGSPSRDEGQPGADTEAIQEVEPEGIREPILETAAPEPPSHKRFGTFEAEITEALIKPFGQTNETDVFFPGERLSIRLRLRFHRDMKNPNVGIAILKYEQGKWFVAYATNTLRRKMNLGLLRKNTSVEVEFVQRLYLPEGQYYLTVAVVDSVNSKYYDWHDNLKSFRVEKAGTQWDGMINLDSQINIRKPKHKK